MRRNNKTTRPPELWLLPTLGTGARHPRRRGQRRWKDNALAASATAGAGHMFERIAWLCPAHEQTLADARGRLGARRGGES